MTRSRRAERRAAAAPKEGAPAAPRPLLAIPFRWQAAILFALAAAIYANTLANRYAYDDAPLVTKNAYVAQGLRGLPKIFTSDAYASFYASYGASSQLAGGRYRPLSIATYAVEHQLLGYEPAVSHAVNVLLYALTLVVLLVFLREVVCPDQPDLAFFAAALFAVHPIHTEVVANIKSRDELLSLLFLLLAFVGAFRHARGGKTRWFALAMVSYGCALLSKEWGVTFLALLPIAFLLFGRMNARQAVGRTMPYAGVAAAFLALRFRLVAGFSGVVETEILNNPFVLATKAQALATKLFVLLKYLALLVWPARLSADYSWAAIPYRDLGDALVWLSIAVHVGLVALGVWAIRRRPLITFAVAFYLANLALVSNLLVPLGAMMGERLVYHSSVGFCLLLAAALLALPPRVPRAALLAGIAAILLAGAARTIVRNPDWKDDATLWLHDVEVVPDAVIANGNACDNCIRLAGDATDEATRAEYEARAVGYCTTALANHPGYVNGWIDLGVARLMRGELEAAGEAWGEVRRLYPTHPGTADRAERLAHAYYDRAQTLFGRGDFAGSLRDLEACRCLLPEKAEPVFRMGGIFLTRGEAATARAYWEEALRIEPGNEEVWVNAATLYFSLGNVHAARDAASWALELKPDDARAQSVLKALGSR